ncbi:phospholipase effector Tle1 domain-containing protein [Bradyrhizobium sp.]|uniref:phospholipase effector Tle1 domain-containing protein n=1 Tax=Bradyrhizobium sp. TaxID=376 RepID=UPI004037A403
MVLSDGTGNSAAKIWRTNVWRLFEAIEKQKSNQVAFYDDGVGTSPFKPLALIGGIFGYGLKRNVLECYKFICRNYREGDEIYLFGFSRGAFTIRVLVELIEAQGLIRYSNSETELNRLAAAAFRAYRAKLHTIFRIEQPFRLLRDLLLRTPYHKLPVNPKRPSIQFVGLWDTVSAYGLPLEEMTRIVSLFFFPLELCSDRLPPFVSKACHALSLDDERKTFHPLLIRETPEDICNGALIVSPCVV